jgi:uncharacterized protein (DUF4415 family)
MVSGKHTIALEADPTDPEDGDVTAEALEQALAERRARVARRGRPAGSTKEKVTLRLDHDVVAAYKATGKGWQTRINEALRKAVG